MTVEVPSSWPQSCACVLVCVLARRKRPIWMYWSWDGISVWEVFCSYTKNEIIKEQTILDHKNTACSHLTSVSQFICVLWGIVHCKIRFLSLLQSLLLFSPSQSKRTEAIRNKNKERVTFCSFIFLQSYQLYWGHNSTEDYVRNNRMNSGVQFFDCTIFELLSLWGNVIDCYVFLSCETMLPLSYSLEKLEPSPSEAKKM